MESDPQEKFNLVAIKPEIAFEFQQIAIDFQNRFDYFRKGGHTKNAPVIKNDLIEQRLKNLISLQQVFVEDLEWNNADGKQKTILTNGQLHFGSEKSRSYATIPLPEGTTYLLTQFKVPIPSLSVVNYTDFIDKNGQRINLHVAFAQQDLSPDGNWDILIPVPAEAQTAIIAFKSDDKTQIKFIESLKLTFLRNDPS
jgi:hypothetical protein